MKYCISCETSKPLTEFNRHCKTADRKQSYCKPCARLATRLSRIRCGLTGYEKRAEQSRRYYYAHRTDVLARIKAKKQAQEAQG